MNFYLYFLIVLDLIDVDVPKKGIFVLILDLGNLDMTLFWICQKKTIPQCVERTNFHEVKYFSL